MNSHFLIGGSGGAACYKIESLTSIKVERQIKGDLALGDDKDVVVGGEEGPLLDEGDVTAGGDVGVRLRAFVVAERFGLVKWKRL